MEAEIIFSETQRFRQWWIWMILIFAAADAVWVAAMQLGPGAATPHGQPFLPLLLLLIPAGVFVFLFSIKLQTKIRQDGIYVRFFPIHKKFRFYPWSEIETAHIRKYSPIGEYGGWGLRGLGKNRALNVAGNQGLQLVMKDGLRLLIGTQKPAEVDGILAARQVQKTNNNPYN